MYFVKNFCNQMIKIRHAACLYHVTVGCTWERHTWGCIWQDSLLDNRRLPEVVPVPGKRVDPGKLFHQNAFSWHLEFIQRLTYTFVAAFCSVFITSLIKGSFYSPGTFFIYSSGTKSGVLDPGIIFYKGKVWKCRLNVTCFEI